MEPSRIFESFETLIGTLKKSPTLDTRTRFSSFDWSGFGFSLEVSGLRDLHVVTVSLGRQGWGIHTSQAVA